MVDFIAILIKGGPVMVPLLACSIVSLAVVIDRIIFWRKAQSREPVEKLLQLVEHQEFAEAINLGRRVDLPAARVLTAGLEHRNPSLPKALEVAAQTELPVLKKRLTILDTIITLAPLLGLLGTITDMISSFSIMSEAGLRQPHAVTSGVTETLIATAAGLLIAILTLIPYNYFSNRAERELEEIEYYGSRLELLLAEQEGKN